MENENSSSLKKLETFFSQISETQDRFILINYSHAFSDMLSFNVEKLRRQYQVINFKDILNNNTGVSKELYSLPRKIITEIITFITELSPVISLTNFIANAALQFCNYYIKRSDIKELRKNLHIHRKPHKYKKLRKVIVARDLSSLLPDDIAYLDLIGDSIKNGYITSAVLVVISDQEFGIFNLLDVSSAIDLPFTMEDYETITGSPLPNPRMLEIVNTLGIKCINELEQFYKSDNNIVLKSARDIINLLIKDKKYDKISSQLDYFLKVCSILFEEFKLFDLENLEKHLHISYKDMLPASLEVSLLETGEMHTYHFTENIFRKYYRSAGDILLEKTTYLKIMDYLKTEYPTQYADLAVSSLVMPISEDQRLSYFIIAYYHRKKQNLKFHTIIKETLDSTPLGSKFLTLELQKSYPKSFTRDKIRQECNVVMEIIKSNTDITPEARLCVLSYIADLMYSTEDDIQQLMQVFHLYQSIFTEIRLFSEPKKLYIDYVLDAIAFSTAIENYDVQKIADRLIVWLDSNNPENQTTKIKFYKLGNLLFALNPNKSKTYTELAFELSKNNIILHEETRINYSVSLLGLREYEKAYRLLMDCKIITPDYRVALENNKYIAGYLSGHYNISKLARHFKELAASASNSLTGDYPIILNNYMAALIVSGTDTYYNKIMECAKILLRSTDPYHIFYTTHNLMVYSYLRNDFNGFKDYASEIKIPYLLRKQSDIFKMKISILEENFGKYKTTEALTKALLSFADKESYAQDLYMLPVLWGLLERWFK